MPEDCGCEVVCRLGEPEKERIKYCPLHAAAGEMRDALIEAYEDVPGWVEKAKALISKARP